MILGCAWFLFARYCSTLSNQDSKEVVCLDIKPVLLGTCVSKSSLLATLDGLRQLMQRACRPKIGCAQHFS
jgi:hypothetical protein